MVRERKQLEDRTKQNDVREYSLQKSSASTPNAQKNDMLEKMSEKNSTTLQKSLQKTDTGLQKSLQKIFEGDPYISTTKAAELLGVSRQTIAVQIAKLKAQGRLRRIGPDKGGHWEVINNKE